MHKPKKMALVYVKKTTNFMKDSVSEIKIKIFITSAIYHKRLFSINLNANYAQIMASLLMVSALIKGKHKA